MMKILRRCSARYLALSAIFLIALEGLFYVNYIAVTSSFSATVVPSRNESNSDVSGAKLVVGVTENLVKEEEAEKSRRDMKNDLALVKPKAEDAWVEPVPVTAEDKWLMLKNAETQVDTVEQFKKFEFYPSWMKSGKYWDTNLEERYTACRKKWAELPLKVIIVPHSHNDPGWLKTFETYYHDHTRNILNNMVEKLQVLHNMTFIWTEVAFFAKWWESAHPSKRRVVRKLLDEGRLEITTGGWVMMDEANTHIYAMVDQLIEGHQWVKNHLGVTPKSGWSIDPFGHGATVPYLLKASGFTGGTVIQRIHYAWKQWLAEQQMGDFKWRQNWDTDGRTDILVHNLPFDLYSIKHSCGPDPRVCVDFDFRKLPEDYILYWNVADPIHSYNMKEKAELLLGQYGRTGSLFHHNVVLVPLGDDFRYDRDIEWNQQYENYARLLNFINNNKGKYNAEVQFGTPSDYFKAVNERSKTFPSLRGDFFVYSDIRTPPGEPAYWSGYFTTRPYWKILDRELEASLRSAEILYTIALNRARQTTSNQTIQLLERDYELLNKARKILALFQHHDAITGTSKAYVMHDYALKLFEGIQDTVYIQGRCAQSLLLKDFKEIVNSTIIIKKAIQSFVNYLLPDTDSESYEKLTQKVPLIVPQSEPRRIVVFNSLPQQRQEVVKVRTLSPNVRVLDSDGNLIPFQVNPVWNLTGSVSSLEEARISEDSENGDTNRDSLLQMVRDLFEVIFVADLPPLSLMVFIVQGVAERNLELRTIVYCASCANDIEDTSNVPPFDVRSMAIGDIRLENHRMMAIFNGRSGFLKSVIRKSTGRTTQCGLQFAAYPSAQSESGAYLFKPDPNSQESEREVLFDEPYGRRNLHIVVTTGPIASELIVIYSSVLTHSARIYHVAGPLSEGIYIENIIDFGAPPKNNTELFMRVVSNISNGDPPEFYSDQNGFQMQRRVKVERIGIEGNYFPITSMAYIQDTTRRLSLLVNHAQGAASWQKGWLEVMLDRRTLYDDSRGMGEGIMDNKRVLIKFWLLLEEINAGNEKDTYSRPSLFAHHLSNSFLYPADVFVVEGISEGQQSGNQEGPMTLHKEVQLLTKPFPCDVHLLNMRTSSDPNYAQFPSSSSLLVLHRQGYACNVGAGTVIPQCGLEPGTEANPSPAFHKRTLFRDLKLHTISQTTLTGLHEKAKYASLDDVRMELMELLTLNVTFLL